jgi:hypothetical protein
MTPGGCPASASRANADSPVRRFASSAPYSPPGSRVIGPFLGSGTVAAVTSAGLSTGIGADERWCQTPDCLAAAPAPVNSVRNNAAPFK